MSAYTPPCAHGPNGSCSRCSVADVRVFQSSDVAYARGVADERDRIAKALERDAAGDSYSSSSCALMVVLAALIRRGDLQRDSE